jgi:hypothetical protein
MTGFRQFRKTRAAKVSVVATVLAVGAFGMAVSGGNSVAADESSSSHWSGGWSTAAGASAAHSSRAIEAAAAARGDLVLRAHTLREADVDANGDGKFGPGDYFVFEEALRRPHSPKRVGTDSVRCMANVRTFMCDGTLRIYGRGKITIAGSFFFEDDVALSVTGGSGKYRHASGQFRVFDRPDGNSLFVLDLRTR